MGAETVSERMNGGRLDVGTTTDILELLENMPVALTLSVREYLILAGAIRILLEEKLLHGR